MGFAIKSKETSSKLAIYTVAVHANTIPAGWVYPCMHKWNTLSSTCTRFNPYFGWFVLLITMPAKVGIKSCRLARECVSFVHAWMYVPTQIESCFYNQLAR